MVEWKKLGEVEDSGVLTLGRGQVISKIDMNNCPGDYPVYSSSSQNNGEIGRYGKYMFDDERITWSIDGGGKFFYRCGLKYSVTNVCGWLKVNQENILRTRFLYYLLFEEWSNKLFDYNHKAHPSVIRKEYLIPFISLQEQERIVGILDTFTASIDNLKAQIEQRRKQYEHYRDQLLDLEGKEGVEMKTLGEVTSPNCSLSYGIVQPGDDIEDGVPVVRPIDLTGLFVYRKGLKKTTYEISDSYKRTILSGDEILFCVRGTTGVMSLASTELKGCNVTRGIVPISFKNNLTKIFVFYVLKSHNLQRKIADKTNGTALKQINVKDLRQLPIPLPSLQEQERIVGILDKFEQSITNLEAQLEQRQKQYEYYREKLLTFE